MIAMGEEPEIAALWLDSPVVDVETIIGDRLEQMRLPRMLTQGGILMARLVSGDDLTAFSVTDALAKLNNRPLHLVHCQNDQVTPVRYAYSIAEKAHLSMDSLWVVPECDHVRAEFVQLNEYETRLFDFFDKHL